MLETDNKQSAINQLDKHFQEVLNWLNVIDDSHFTQERPLVDLLQVGDEDISMEEVNKAQSHLWLKEHQG